MGASCAEGAPQSSGPLLEVMVVIAPREQGRQEPGHCLSQFLFNFSHGLLHDPEKGREFQPVPSGP